MNELKDRIHCAFEALPELLRDYRSRPGQRVMASETAGALISGGISIIEAPTGIGKTLGYLIPGIIAAVKRRRRLIVSTATVALQEQIRNKDYPVAARAAAAAGVSSSVAVLKGRERYVCPVRLDHRSANGDLFESGDAVFPIMRAALEAGAWDGDRDHWNSPIDEKEWRAVNNQRGSCLGRRCPQRQRCPAVLAREAASSATVVVASHDLVLSSLAKLPDSVFGRFEENFYVFDEGHGLPAKAIASCAHEADVDERLANEAAAVVERSDMAILLPAVKTAARAAAHAIRAVKDQFEERAPGGMLRFPFGRLPPEFAALERVIVPPLERLEALVLQTAEVMGEDATASPLTAHAAAMVAGAAERLSKVISAWRAFFGEEGPARWIERDGARWRIHASPFSAAGILDDLLWRRTQGAVITSATLTSCGGFDHALSELGLSQRDGVRTVKLPSPFDWSSRASIVVPRRCPAPSEEDLHSDAVVDEIVRALAEDRGGVLALFASARQMKRVRSSIPQAWSDHVIVQGDAPVPEIVRRHMARVDAGLPSAILGLSSFYEGIDLPGRYLTTVIVAKIPFPPPDEPLVAAASEHLAAMGLDAFSLLHLPIAGLRLAQAAGRLLRREDDWGEIRILDRRLVERAYGRRLAAGLPAQVRHV